MTDVQLEGLKSRLRQSLHRDQVKLWLSPYTNEEDGSAAQFPQELVEKYSKDLQIPPHLVADALESLRAHAVEKLAAKRKFLSSGLATVRVTVTGSEHNVQTKLKIEADLSWTARRFKEKLSEHTQIPVHEMKIICSGHFLEDGEPLSTQGLSNNGHVMLLCLAHTEAQAAQAQIDAEKSTAQVAKTRRAAEVLSGRQDGGRGSAEKFYLEINDQSGKPINLPEEERKSLALALTLHEKGRNLLKQKRFPEALLFLLEADKEFNQCHSDILQAVDNYAVLCLDIVWCYLCLKSVNYLPDAEEKLDKCEQCFKRSYGSDMQRLVAVRGGSGQEICLFVRLYLLKAVCAFHRGNFDLAGSLLDKAEDGIQKLKIDDNKLSQLLSMGFTGGESRVGLRVCHGDVTSAVDYITRRREEKYERRKREKKEQQDRKLGKTADGSWIDSDIHKVLLDMGFSSSSSTEALRQTNNDIDKALQVLQEHPELLNKPSTSGAQNYTIPQDLIAQVVSMGFGSDQAREALQKHNGAIQAALEELLKSVGSGPSEQAQADSDSIDPDIQRELQDLASCVPEDEDAYLDIDVEEEAMVITEYRSLLASLQASS